MSTPMGTTTPITEAVTGSNLTMSGQTLGDMAWFNGTEWVRVVAGIPAGTTSLPIGGGVISAVVVASDASADLQNWASFLRAQGKNVWLCDGTADNVEIQAAIDSLTSGGKVQLSGGTFNIAVALDPVSNMAIVGHGLSTILQTSADVKIFLIENSETNVTISNMLIDGLKTNGYTSHGISLSGVSYITIDNIEIKNCGSTSGNIVIYGSNNINLVNIYSHNATNDGISGNQIHEISVQNCKLNSNGRHGLWFFNNGGPGHENYALNINQVSALFNNNSGIYLSDNGTSRSFHFNINNVITNDNVNNDGVLLIRMRDGNVGNVVSKGNGGDGIVVDSCDGINVSNATLFYNQGRGLFITDDVDPALTCVNVNATNIIAYNNDQGNTGCAGINLDDSTYCNVTNSRCYDNQTPKTQEEGIEETGTSDYNIIIGNNVSVETIGIVKAGSHTIVRSNLGYVTENSGTATVASGQTSIVVNHGLATTPTRVQVTPTLLSNAASFWVTDKGATQFTIHVNADPGAGTATFDWRASIGEGN